MDIQYLLLLQHFREGVGAPLAPFCIWISDFIISFWGFAAMALIYWVYDRQGGRRILLGFGLGVILNALLKMTFCIYRPWIRDAQIIPYGNAIQSAGGYSFPSGHSTRAATVLGGISFLLKKKGYLLPACLLFFVALIVLFSRNYLGVHTPQDVIVGFLLGLLGIYIAEKTETWADKDEKRDLIVIGAALVICAAIAVYYECKTYPEDFLPNGKLLYDAIPTIPYQYQGLGGILGYTVARYFERRGFDFEETERRSRLVVGLLALIPLYALLAYTTPLLMPLIGERAAQFSKLFLFFIYILNVVPCIMQCVCKKKDK